VGDRVTAAVGKTGLPGTVVDLPFYTRGTARSK
jgi:hypothetical protein